MGRPGPKSLALVGVLRRAAAGGKREQTRAGEPATQNSSVSSASITGLAMHGVGLALVSFVLWPSPLRHKLILDQMYCLT